ncbi:MAG: carboxylating nicotinate-nucleotide diphosphorylase [Nitrosopumilus sp.]|nr:carboxylating nicotinate-nucleotide diphosphorylase [Nitrosopumilus sp.]MDA7958920.1 carboxylating nicotinate-nucleotide diphosphorylase [Nitrosopumilus sp.]
MGSAGQVGGFLSEDIGGGDVTSALLPNRRISAVVTAGEPCTVAGLEEARRAFRSRRCSAGGEISDGDAVQAGDAVLRAAGPARRILECERTALNILSRMSGVATATRAMADMMPREGMLYCTRKTMPGLRGMDQRAVLAGGGLVRRGSLDESILIKDNHLAVLPLAEIMRRAREAGGTIEVEVEDAGSAAEAARLGASTIMLDNMGPAAISRVIARLEREGLRDGVRIEASGGITPRNAARYGRSGADIISSGYMTRSAPGIDFSLEVEAP